MIIDPQGEVIAEATGYQEEMVVADLSSFEIEKVRKNGGWAFFHHYRRPELYGLTSQQVV